MIGEMLDIMMIWWVGRTESCSSGFALQIIRSARSSRVTVSRNDSSLQAGSQALTMNKSCHRLHCKLALTNIQDKHMHLNDC